MSYEISNNANHEESVSLRTLTLSGILEYNLNIPEYQRIYCWPEKNVYHILDDIFFTQHKTYYLGSIILQRKGNFYDIIDGQQRLVTLSLILDQMEHKTQLLEQHFESEEANEFVGYNKYLIQEYIKKFKWSSQTKEQKVKCLLNTLSFSVLVLDDSSLDLAYTFFTNQNSRGKPLTDYELLKSHHLKYVTTEEQAKHLAMRWDEMILKHEHNDNNCERDVSRTLGMHLFRLRKWMRKQNWWEDEPNRVKNEFEAALVIPDIPAFGEQFNFNESIQGGSHFFAYADLFVYKFNQFKQTSEYNATKCLDAPRQYHYRYRDVIQTLLFAYYLKFGGFYLADALFCISRIISKFRYDSSSAKLPPILQYAGNSEIVMMIDRATSPTFFLAETMNLIRKFPSLGELSGVREDYHRREAEMLSYGSKFNNGQPLLRYAIDEIKTRAEEIITNGK